MIRTLILDFDGTLADTQTSILSTTHAALQEMGLPQPSDDFIRSLIGLPLKDMFLRYPGIKDEAMAQTGFDTYKRLFDLIAEQTFRLFPKVEATLRQLRSESSIKIITASSRMVASQEHLLGLTNIRECFDLLCGLETVKHQKPAPDMVLHILDVTQTAAHEALVVGDATYDIIMGQGANCHTCAVTYGNQSAEQLNSAQPEFIIDNFEEVGRLALEL